MMTFFLTPLSFSADLGFSSLLFLLCWSSVVLRIDIRIDIHDFCCCYIPVFELIGFMMEIDVKC